MSLSSIPRAPRWTLLATEPLRASWEYLVHCAQRAPTYQAGAETHPVVIFPGLATNGLAMAPLRRHCRALGHPAMDWGRGFNRGPTGDVSAWLDELAAHTSRLLDCSPGRASLIGWSLGGFYAREVAKRLADRVRQVITIGTPFNGEPSHTNVEWLFKVLNNCAPFTEALLSGELRIPPPVPSTAVYSRADGIVNWDVCRHTTDVQGHRNVEIAGSHIGMGWNPQVLQIIERLLTEHNDTGLPARRRSTRQRRA
jgi:pimeloyl-ACP methyl ester carboxylesterase